MTPADCHQATFVKRFFFLSSFPEQSASCSPLNGPLLFRYCRDSTNMGKIAGADT